MDKRVCHCCEYAMLKKTPRGGIVIPLEGGWTLNHFSGKSRNILGRLVLVTQKHYPTLSELGDTEASKLGIHVKGIESALKECSVGPYKHDPIEGIYTAYFNETQPQHVHVHIFPRNKALINALNKLAEPFDVWKLGKLLEYQRFHDDYKVVKDGRLINENLIEKLMRYLSRVLANETTKIK